MKVKLILACVAAGVALGATPAAADNTPEAPLPRAEVTVTPKKAVAGSKVTINVVCSELSPVSSAALKVGSLTKQTDKTATVVAIVKNVKAGTYKVSTKCGVVPISTTFTVTGKSKTQVPVKPKGAPETGGE